MAARGGGWVANACAGFSYRLWLPPPPEQTGADAQPGMQDACINGTHPLNSQHHQPSPVCALQEPHFVPWINHLRCSFHGSLAWAALWLTVLAFKKQPHRSFQVAITTGMLAGLAPAMLLFYAASHLRLKWTMGRILQAFR
jgi:hypothetical protein